MHIKGHNAMPHVWASQGNIHTTPSVGEIQGTKEQHNPQDSNMVLEQEVECSSPRGRNMPWGPIFSHKGCYVYALVQIPHMRGGVILPLDMHCHAVYY